MTHPNLHDVMRQATMLGRKALVRTAVASLAASAMLSRHALGQDGLIKLVVGYPPGGASNRAARLVAERMQQILKRTVVVENRAGAGGRLAAQQLVNTPADQTMLMIGNPAVMNVAPLVYKDLKYDAQKDFHR